MRLVDADALEKRISLSLMEPLGASLIILIDNQPTVDAEIVVRCQNCKYHGSCGYEDIPGWFCADGERREDDAKEST